jgi:hypothetical protein
LQQSKTLPIPGRVFLFFEKEIEMSVRVDELIRRPVLDKDLQKVAEFMAENMQANKLVSVAKHLPKIAELLWGHYDDIAIEITPLSLESDLFKYIPERDASVKYLIERGLIPHQPDPEEKKSTDGMSSNN